MKMFKSVSGKIGIINNFLCRKTHKWVQPNGYDTGIKIYNCITKNNSPLVVNNKDLVTWYTCGPTVYDSAHLGHASCYVKLDTIQRILKNYFHLNLVVVMNITDIDDKIINKSQQLKTSPQELSKHYEKEFWEDLELLNVSKPNLIVRVTENMHVIQKFIENLINSNYAYLAEDKSVYFNVKNYENYGKLQRLGDGFMDKDFKKSSADFVLWKAAKQGEPSWTSIWGPGRPGWHIECSALASHIFGQNIDIHAGGIDLRFPHHENEEAQSCCYHSVAQWVNYWVHTGHLQLKDTKMSKSLKNTISIRDFLKTNKLETFRMACVMTHYKDPVTYSDELMKTADNLLRNYKNFLDNCANYVRGELKCTIDRGVCLRLLVESGQSIDNELKNDFNTPKIINILNNIVFTFNGMINKDSLSNFEPAVVIALSNLVSNTLNLLGVVEDKSSKNQKDFGEIMDILNELRQQVRLIAIKEKNFALLKVCDVARDDLRKYGIFIKDLEKKSTWSN